MGSSIDTGREEEKRRRSGYLRSRKELGTLRILGSCFVLMLMARAVPAPPYINAAKADPTTETLTATDLEVIDAVCKEMVPYFSSSRRDRTGDFLVIVEECSAGEVKDGGFLPAELVDAPATATLFLDMWKRNTCAFRLGNDIRRGGVVLVGSKRVRALTEQKRLWKEFPKCPGFFSIWLPGYSHDRTQAGVYVFTFYGDDGDGLVDGVGLMVYLEQAGRGWKVIKQEERWRT